MSDAFRIGLIGCGNISRRHRASIRAHANELVLTAACDVDEARAQAVAAEAPGCRAHADWCRMLGETPLDGVIICLPHVEHAPVALAAIDAGHHVLVEKPMACTVAEGRQMVDAAAQAGVVLMAAQHQRFEPTYRAVRRIIASRAIGDVYAVRFDCMQSLRAYGPPGHWLYDGAVAGGGVVISLAVHRLDLLRFLLGDDVVRVQAIAQTRDGAFINGAEDQAAGTLEFGKGALGEFFATYSGYRMPYGEGFMIFGERGAVHGLPPVGQYVGPALIAAEGWPGTPPIKDWLDQYTGFTPVAPEQDDLPTGDAFENELLHFVGCSRTGTRPLSDGRDNLGTLALVDAIYESARTGAAVRPAVIDQG